MKPFTLFTICTAIVIAFSSTACYQMGITRGRELEKQDFYAEAISNGAGYLDAVGDFHFKKP